MLYPRRGSTDLRYSSETTTFYQNNLPMRNIANVTGSEPIAVWSQAISSVRVSVLSVTTLTGVPYEVASNMTDVNSSRKHCIHHRISIPAYAIEQQWWQLGVSKNEMSLMSFIFRMMLVIYQSGSISGVISNIYWHASKWYSISISHWREFSFPRFGGLRSVWRKI
jgi:hypothetical protein